jgi:2-polyprenyl-3-methyl-5-hydroxy-6-metoxy-1,4-benzoquinol methylase
MIIKRNKCPACDSLQRAESYKIDGGQWEQCADCGLFYIESIEPYPYVIENRELGPDVIRQTTFNEKETKIARVINNESDEGRSARFDKAVRLATNTNSVLEIGFGGSENLDYAKKMGWPIVVGFEVLPDFVLFARSRGHDAHRVEVSCHDKQRVGPERGFGVVYATEVMEHVVDPRGFLIGASKYLAPEGVLWASFASVKNFDIFVKPIPPSALDEWHWWTKKSIEELAKRCGLTIIDIEEESAAFFVTMKMSTDYDKYCIKTGYKTNDREYELDLTQQGHKDGIEAQQFVFEEAKRIVVEKGYNKILDVGTGSAIKLMEYFNDKDTLGIEVKPNYESLLEKYPNRRWMYADYSRPLGEQFDVVICADVIEHVMEPDIIMKWISDIDAKCVIFSTPDRGLLPAWFDSWNGPPYNGGHVREWTAEEFINYVRKWLPTYESTYTTRPVGVMTISIKKHV